LSVHASASLPSRTRTMRATSITEGDEG
jgi:hypothetical protein